MNRFYFFYILIISTLQLQAQNYTLSNQTFTGVKFGSVTLGDVNGDDVVDILITGEDNSLNPITQLYINDGVGNFTLSNQSFEGVKYSHSALTDVNSDTFNDIVIAGWDASSEVVSKIYINDGNGNFIEDSSQTFNQYNNTSIAFADADNDADEDILITGWDATLNPTTALFINNGTNAYEKDETQNFIGVSESSIAWGNANGDTYNDVYVSGWDASFNVVSQLYTNDGNGNFLPALNQPFPSVVFGAVAFKDIDGDNDDDFFIIGQDDASNLIAELYINNQAFLSVDEAVQTSDFTVFPNPTNGIVTLNNPKLKNITAIALYDILGRLIRKISKLTIKNAYQLQLSQLNAGAYFLIIEQGSSITTKRIIKQ